MIFPFSYLLAVCLLLSNLACCICVLAGLNKQMKAGKAFLLFNAAAKITAIIIYLPNRNEFG